MRLHYVLRKEGNVYRYTLREEPPKELVDAVSMVFYNVFLAVGADEETAHALVKTIAASIYFVGPKITVKQFGRYFEYLSGRGERALSIYLARVAKRTKLLTRRREGVYLIDKDVLRKIYLISNTKTKYLSAGGL